MKRTRAATADRCHGDGEGHQAIAEAVGDLAAQTVPATLRWQDRQRYGELGQRETIGRLQEGGK